MRLCQFYPSEETQKKDLRLRWPSSARFGVLEGSDVVDLTDGLGTPWLEGPTPNAVIAFLASGRTLEECGAEEAPRHRADDVFFAPPVLRPSNFMDFYAFEQHVKAGRARRGLEMEPTWYDVPAYYNTTPYSFYGDGETVSYPAGEDRMDYELELACVVGTSVRNANEQEAKEAIAGYTILNDCSARSRQQLAMKIGLGPSPGKDFGSALGPWLVTADEIPDYTVLGMRAFVNDEIWSDGVAGAMQHSFEAMIQYASCSRTLFPGDVIGSGTVGGGCGLELDRYLQPGDVVRLEIDQLGSLATTVTVDVG
jgi:2-keto-4-pentenoate hydratase/2-oxohepta-3-ene-1,7-dioic acid hydratase in catechol pathway